MDVAYISGLSALAGSVIGGLTSGVTTWLNQRSLARAGQLAHELSRRQDLYKDFIVAASKALRALELHLAAHCPVKLCGGASLPDRGPGRHVHDRHVGPREPCIEFGHRACFDSRGSRCLTSKDRLGHASCVSMSQGFAGVATPQWASRRARQAAWPACPHR